MYKMRFDEMKFPVNIPMTFVILYPTFSGVSFSVQELMSRAPVRVANRGIITGRRILFGEEDVWKRVSAQGNLDACVCTVERMQT